MFLSHADEYLDTKYPTLDFQVKMIHNKGIYGLLKFFPTSIRAKELLAQDIEDWAPPKVTPELVRAIFGKNEAMCAIVGQAGQKGVHELAEKEAGMRTLASGTVTTGAKTPTPGVDSSAPTSASPTSARRASPRLSTLAAGMRPSLTMPKSTPHQTASTPAPADSAETPASSNPDEGVFVIDNSVSGSEWEEKMQAVIADRQRQLDQRRRKIEDDKKALEQDQRSFKNFAVVIERVAKRG